MFNARIYSFFTFIYKKNHNKCLMLRYIVLYKNIIIIIKCLLIIIIILKFIFRQKRETNLYYVQLSRALHELQTPSFLHQEIR